MASGEIAKKLSLNPYIAGKIRTQSRSFTPEFLQEAVDACVEAESAVKTGNLNDQLAVETLICQLSRP
jgi:DNA polymerase-3 subunit delta